MLWRALSAERTTQPAANPRSQSVKQVKKSQHFWSADKETNSRLKCETNLHAGYVVAMEPEEAMGTTMQSKRTLKFACMGTPAVLLNTNLHNVVCHEVSYQVS